MIIDPKYAQPGVGSKANPFTSVHQDSFLVSCPACGASKGSECRHKDGSKAVRVHLVRAQKLAKKKDAAHD